MSRWSGHQLRRGLAFVPVFLFVTDALIGCRGDPPGGFDKDSGIQSTHDTPGWSPDMSGSKISGVSRTAWTSS